MALVLLVACTPQQSPRSSTPTPSRSPVAAATPTPVPTPRPRPPCVAFQSQPAAASGPRSSLPVLVWASGMSQPDDVLASADGAVYVGELNTGRIIELGGKRAPDGSLFRLPARIPTVEGLARIGDVFYAADQADDRIVSFHLGDATTQPFFQLTPVPSLDGVDSIAASADTVIVPDSARGTVYFVGTDGKTKRSVGGFLRPTGAWPMPDGSTLVADENAGAIVRVGADGAKQVILSGLPLADDVAVDQQGAVYAISITRNNLVQVADGTAREVVGGLAQPQGLGIDGAGNVLLTEFDAGRLDLVLTAFKLLPAATVAALMPGQGLCVQLQRAPGFADALTIAPDPSYAVVQEPGAGVAGEVVPGPCASPPCLISIQVRGGARTDAVYAAYKPA